MVIPLEHRITMHGVMGSTAYRGCACFLKRRRTDGQLEFRTPISSVEAAKSCYIVDWTDDSDYTVVAGGSTSAARDYTTGRKKATFYADGWFRTNIYWDRDNDIVSQLLTITTDTAHFSAFSSVTIVPLYACATVTGASAQGYLTASSDSCGFGTKSNALVNYNFELLNVDVGSPAPYGRGLWIEFKSIESRTDAGYVVSTPSTRTITY